MPKIDPTAKVHPRAELADDVVIGPFAIVDEYVRLGSGTVVDSHCVITGHTELGCNNHIYPFAVVGTTPQDATHRGEPTRLLIGNGNRIREYVTINTGTIKGGGVTIVGNNNLLMACAHIAHDCIVGDRVIMANCALLAGHVKVEDGVVFSGHVAIHHFVTLGSVCMIGGLTGVTQDVPPYMMMVIDHKTPRGVNVVGMSRNGFSTDEIRSVQYAFRLVYRSKMNAKEATRELEATSRVTAPVRNFLEFLARSERGRLGRFLETTRTERGDTMWLS